MGVSFGIAGDQVHGLDRGEVMADRTDAAQALHRDRDLPIGAALDENFKTAKLDDVQTDLMDLVVGVEEQRDLAVALDPCDGVDGDAAQRFRPFGGFQSGHVRPQSKRKD